tara:strand:+ start:1057 stop:1236 length:180 start_codon:yes stop_codon:yes gene_type:complete
MPLRRAYEWLKDVEKELERLAKKVQLLEQEIFDLVEFIELEGLKESLDVWIKMRRKNND